jgi:N-methylhydantoinase A
VTVAKGLDVRDFTLTPFGGSGSLLACRLMDILNLPRTLVPPNPGNVSAFGLLTVDVRNDYVQTVVSKHVDLDLDRVRSVYAELEGRAQEALDGEGFDRDSQRMQRTADLRYVGQAFEVRVPVADGELDRAAAEDVAQAFHAAHRQLYGYDFATDPRQAVEWVNLRVSGIGPIRRPDIVELPQRDGGTDRAVTGSRRVFFDAEHTAPSSGGGWIDTPTYNRPDLAPGDVVTGPAIIEEFGSTVPVHPGFAVTVDAYGNLLLTKESAL